MRPASFGFYGTQWRTWPGQEVTQAAHTEPAAPVMPPKSEVPTADEESPVPGFELPAPSPENTPLESPEPTLLEPADPESAPSTPLQADPAPLPEPDAAPRSVKPGVPAEDNLFDEATLRRRSQERLAMLGQAAAQQERVRLEALRQQAQRLVRPAVADAAAAAIRPPVAAAGPITDRDAGQAELVLPASEDRESRSLRQAVHAEVEPRGLRAARTPLQGNPLRGR